MTAPLLRLVGDAQLPPAPRVAVAIPVRNEVEHIGACLLALDRQQGARADRVLLLLNGCTDGSEAEVRRIIPHLQTNIDMITRQLHGAQATAGFARSLAMRLAAAGLTGRDVLMTTDADSQVAPEWIAANLAALQRGADVVCGQAVIDPAEARLIPAQLHADDALERELACLIDELTHLLDPDPHDPWPRHGEHSGASIAVRVAAWRRAGGVPPIASGEDRAFIDRLRQIDARIRHAPGVRVTVSGRTVGRAAGGMADTIRRRIVRQDEFIDSAIEPAADRLRRISWRAQARALWEGLGTDHVGLARGMGVTSGLVRCALAAPFFGAAWARLERASPLLCARAVRFVDLPAEIEAARALYQAVCSSLAPASVHRMSAG
jgi:GT2 family glycosyltransferase